MPSLVDLVLHSRANLTTVALQMRFHVPPQRVAYPLESEVLAMSEALRKSSCAVVGASAALRNCSHARDICGHDVVLRVNHHRPAFCNRTDVQVLNAFACMSSACPHPRLFRIRTEWNPEMQSSFSRKRTWLSSGFVTDYTTRALTKVHTRRCCGTTGGSAVALALHACKDVTLYGLGGVGMGYFESPRRAAPGGVHNLQGELEWYRELERAGAVVRRC